MSIGVKFQQIRNATIVLWYGGGKFVVDPWLQRQGEGDIFLSTDVRKNSVHSPLTELPVSIEELFDDVDAIVVTHLHNDHFGIESAAMIPNKDIPVFAQSKEDAAIIAGWGFNNTCVLCGDNATVKVGAGKTVRLIKTGGLHGESQEKALGPVCGVVFATDGQRSVYVAGDTVWCPAVRDALSRHAPGIVVLNACDARNQLMGRLLMDAEDVRQVCQSAPRAKVIASHMGAVNHAFLERNELRKFAKENDLSNLLVPSDGDIYYF